MEYDKQDQIKVDKTEDDDKVDDDGDDAAIVGVDVNLHMIVTEMK